MTSPREGAGKEAAREILRLENEKDERIKTSCGAEAAAYTACWHRQWPALGRAYLDLLSAARAVVYESGSGEMPAENEHYALLERLAGVAPDEESGPSHEGRNI